MEIHMPAQVREIIKRLQQNGYQAYAVGGCIRDSLRGKTPQDWDIATNALPAQVVRCFSAYRLVQNGIAHGTIGVVLGRAVYEITTYRVDGAYSDNRHPDKVAYTGALEKDLARRDFTINAMAYGEKEGIIDCFGGRADLEKRRIRCVGDAQKRFEEDALRMLRALRFSAQLGFAIEPGTYAAIERLAPTASALSAERVRDEFLKALSSPRPEAAYGMLALGLMARFARAEGPPPALSSLPAYARLARLCFELERRGSIASTAEFLTALRLPRAAVRECSAAAAVLSSGSRDYKRLLRDYGERAVLAAHPRSRALRRVLRSGECFSLSGLAVSGDKLRALGLKGREVGEALDAALEHVIDFPEDNRADILCDFIIGKRDKNGKDA